MSSTSHGIDQSRNQEFWMGFLLAGMGAVLFSAKAIVVKLTYRYGVDALTILGFRMMLSFPFFSVVAFFPARRARRGTSAERRLGKEWVVTCRSRWSPHPLKQHNTLVTRFK